MRVVHYLNQFFAGRGGEEAAGHPPSGEEGPVGPGNLLQQRLGADAEVVGTVVCGDNYVAEHEQDAVAQVLDLIAGFKPDLVVAGPAFNAGRYGVACALVAQGAAQRGIPAVTGMYPENPGVGVAPKGTFIVGTAINASGMNEAIAAMVGLGRKLASGQELGPAEEEGYLPRGIRRNTFADRIAAERAVEQLLRKMAGEPFETEIPLPEYDRVPPSALPGDLSELTIALVTEASVVPRGNPDHLESARCSHWYRYLIAGLEDLTGDEYETVHGGFDNALVNEDPDRVLPLDVMRELEREGVFAELFDDYYVTTGMATAIADAERIGREIAEHVRAAGIHAVLVTSTCGTGTRCGATLAREIDRAGVPAVLMTAMPSVAQNVGANRIVVGTAITHPLGLPEKPVDEERRYRRGMVLRALDLLAQKVEQQTTIPGAA